MKIAGYNPDFVFPTASLLSCRCPLAADNNILLLQERTTVGVQSTVKHCITNLPCVVISCAVTRVACWSCLLAGQDQSPADEIEKQS